MKIYRARYLCEAGLIAALYASLCALSGVFGLSSGAVQLRISEALCVLPAFTPAAIPGLTLGCLIYNLLSGALWQDVIFGTLATLLGAFGARFLRNYRFLIPFPTLVCNTAILPFVLAYAYGMKLALPLLALFVFVGEGISAYLFGMLLYGALLPRRRVLFYNEVLEHKESFAMKDRLPILPPAVAAAVERLCARGFSAYAVGGCVRDALLGKVPNDWDITTSARPEETVSAFADCRVIETGIQHGTVTVILGGTPLEITTYRNDGEYKDNRHPVSVSFSNRIEDDLSRRDFTVNAMAYTPGEPIIDLFGGAEDLEKGMIRAVGDPTTRFEEDGLRILRGIRFASVLDFEIEDETAKAIHACRDLLCNIAPERIRVEFCKLLCGRGAVRILREYIDVIGVFLPELLSCVGFLQNTKYHHLDVFEHTLAAVELAPADLITRLSVLLHDVGKPLSYTEDENGGHFKGHGKVGTELSYKILRRLRFDNDTTDRVCALVEVHDNVPPAEKRAVKRLLRRFGEEDTRRLFEIQKCDRLAHAPLYREFATDYDRLEALIQEIREENACLSLSTMAVKGNDLIAIGIPAGKALGKILDTLLEEVIDGTLPNEKDALLKRAGEIWKNIK